MSPVQDLCAHQEWLDLYLQDHKGIEPKVRQQLEVAKVAPSPAEKWDPIASLLTLRALLFQYQHPQKPADIIGLNTFIMPPKDIIGKRRPLTQVEALASLMRLDFESSAWPCPDIKVLQIMAGRLVELDQAQQLPTGQEVRLIFPDGHEMTPGEMTHGPGSGASPARPAANSSSKQPDPAPLPRIQPKVQRPQSTTSRTPFQFQTAAAAAAAAAGTEGNGPAGIDNLAASMAAAMHGNGSSPNFSNSVDEDGRKVGMLMPAGGDGPYTAEQLWGWQKALIEAHAKRDTARYLELSEGGLLAFKMANGASASMPAAAPAPASKAASATTSKAAPAASIRTSHSGQKAKRPDAPKAGAASGLRRAFLDPSSQPKPSSQSANAPEQEEPYIAHYVQDDEELHMEDLRQQTAAARRILDAQAAASAQASSSSTSSSSSIDGIGMRAKGSAILRSHQLRNQVEKAGQQFDEADSAQAARSAEESVAVRRAEAEAAQQRYEEQAARRAEEAMARKMLEEERARRANEIAEALLKEEEQEQKARQKKIKAKAKKAIKTKTQKKAPASASPAAASSLPDTEVQIEGECEIPEMHVRRTSRSCGRSYYWYWSMCSALIYEY